ncbi:hypothetical protein CR513_39435, partial [Mucuna pruriens]
MTKANISLPRTIKWDEVTLLEKWVMDKATPSIPRPAPYIEDIKQNNSGKVEITFNRRNSFSSRIKASHYGSARRSFSVQTPSIPIGLFRSASHNLSNINFQGLDTTSNIPRTTYLTTLVLIKIPLEKTFTLKKINLRENGFFDTLREKKDNKSKTNFINLSKKSKSIFLSLIGSILILSEKT